MIRGSTYSAIMHLSILAIILFGFPSLRFIWPKSDLKEKPVRVVVMTPQEADQLGQKPPSIADRNKTNPTKETKQSKKIKEENLEDPNKAKIEETPKKLDTTEPKDNKTEADKKGQKQDTKPQATNNGAATSGTKELKKSKRKTVSKPDKLEKTIGGLSVVREADPKAETPDKDTSTKNPTNDEQKGAPVTKATRDSSRQSTKPATEEKQANLASNEITPRKPRPSASRATQFSLVTRPSAPPNAQNTKANPPPKKPSLQGPSQGVQNDFPLKSADRKNSVASTTKPTVQPSSKGVNASIPNARDGKTAVSKSTSDSSQTSQEEAVSTVIKKMIEKLPRLKTLREELMRRGSETKTSPAMETTINRMEKRSKEGYAHAQFSLAEMYLTGEGVTKNTDKAIEFLNSAAIGGYIPAQLALAMLSAEGSTIKQNLAEAHTWLAAAAEQGVKAAQNALPKIEKIMSTRDIIEARKRSYQLRKVLVLIHGADIEKASKSDLSERLRIAAALGDVESVHILLAQGGDADGPDIHGRTAVIEAAWRGYDRIVKSLIDSGANLSALDNTKKNALMWAAINGHANVIKDLIAAGSPIDAQDNEGLTALMRAAWNGHADAVKALVDAKANIRIRDKRNQTALDYAYRSFNKSVQLILTEAATRN